jgi:hypothetical protein
MDLECHGLTRHNGFNSHTRARLRSCESSLGADNQINIPSIRFDLNFYSHIFGAICPERGTGAAPVPPRCNSQAMQWHLDEIASQVIHGAHGVLLLNQAGWHTTLKLKTPANPTLVLLPPRSPELNPAENFWQFMRDNCLSNKFFKSYDDIVNLF